MKPLLAALSLLVVTPLALAQASETISHSYPLSAGGSLSLGNMNGDVEIVVWDKNEVAMEAEKSARDMEVLSRIEINVEASADSVAIKTEHKHAPSAIFGSWFNSRNDFGRVHYKLKVPQSLGSLKVDVMNSNVVATGVRCDVRIVTMNGRITAEGLKSDADLRTMNGGINASFDALDQTQRVRLDTMNGSCTVSVPANSSAAVKASTMNGRITCDPPMALETSSRRSLRGDLGSGSASFSFHSMNGSLTIHNRS